MTQALLRLGVPQKLPAAATTEDFLLASTRLHWSVRHIKFYTFKTMSHYYLDEGLSL